MSWEPIANVVPQEFISGVPASGYYYKFYQSGTTTPTSMATDSTGATTLDKCQLNSDGRPINGSGAVFIPHIDRSYKLALYANSTDADANTFANAVYVLDALTVPGTGLGTSSSAKYTETIVATSDGQSLFTLASSTYSPGTNNILVHYNGSHVEASEISETSPTSFTFNTSSMVKTGDRVNVRIDERLTSSDILSAGSVTYTPAGSGAVTTTADAKLKESVSVKDFGVVLDGVTINTAAFQTALDSGYVLEIPEGTLLTGNVTPPAGTILIGKGKKKSIIKAATGIGQNNVFTFTSVDNIHIESIGFNGDGAARTGVLTDDTLENIMHFASCSNVHIEHCEFTNFLQRAVRFNGSAGDECENITVENSDFSNGSKGGLQVRRYGRNVTVRGNTFTDTVDSTFGGSEFEKPLSVSGTIGTLIDGNFVKQTNGEGGSIICEYIDRQSEDVRIINNKVVGTGSGNNIKVGPCVNLVVANNSCHDAGASGIYIEGCYKYIVENNYVENSYGAGILAEIDGDTSRIPREGLIKDNIIVDINTGAFATGTVAGGGAHQNSYGIYVDGSAVDTRINGNKFIDSAETFNGIFIASTNYTINDNDFTQLHANRITIDNSSSSSGTEWLIKDNIFANTFDRGFATVANGTSEVTVTPNTLVEDASASYFGADLHGTVLSGSVAYFSTIFSTNNTFRILTRNSSHGAQVTTADADFSWWFDCTKTAHGRFGKTT